MLYINGFSTTKTENTRCSISATVMQMFVHLQVKICILTPKKLNSQQEQLETIVFLDMKDMTHKEVLCSWKET